MVPFAMREDASDLIGIVSGREQQNAEHQKSAECPVNLQFAIVQGSREFTAQVVDLSEKRKCSDHPGPSPFSANCAKLRYDLASGPFAVRSERKCGSRR